MTDYLAGANGPVNHGPSRAMTPSEVAAFKAANYERLLEVMGMASAAAQYRMDDVFALLTNSRFDQTALLLSMTALVVTAAAHGGADPEVVLDEIRAYELTKMQED